MSAPDERQGVEIDAGVSMSLSKGHSAERDARREAEIGRLRDLIDKASLELVALVTEACPGEHRPRQHRDGKQPWCQACGRDNRGVFHLYQRQAAYEHDEPKDEFPLGHRNVTPTGGSDS